jgi:hypothetical protein
MSAQAFTVWLKYEDAPVPVKVVAEVFYDLLEAKVKRVEEIIAALEGKRMIVDGNDLLIVEQLQEALMDVERQTWG